MSFRLGLLGCLGLIAIAIPARADLISEFEPNPPGNDPAQASIELSGVANAAFNGFISSIDTDFNDGAVIGSLDRQFAVSGNYDVNGLAVVTVDDLENPSFTLVYSSTSTATVGDVLDLDGDGLLDDPSVFGTVFDAINIPDSAFDATSNMYATQLGGQMFGYTGDEPKLVFRDGTTNDWYAVNDPDNGEVYDINGDVLNGTWDVDSFSATFGSINPTFTAIPEPASASLLGLLGLSAFGLSRRRR